MDLRCSWKVIVALGAVLTVCAVGRIYASSFAHRTYDEILVYFEELQNRCPNIIETWVAQDVFPDMLPKGYDKAWALCGETTCKTLVVRVGNKNTVTNSTPEVYFSGAVHGDERLGPLVVTELAGFLCDHYNAGDEDVIRLVNTRNIWITPATNAHGFYSDRREEKGMDPNRDFSYLQSPSSCMRTQTGRTVNELFRRHLFQFVITFHGGMRALTYEWGSRNHAGRRLMKSTESPDDVVFTQVGEAIRDAAGTSMTNSWWYPLGRINDLVYPVDGGMEDWSYGAGFESSPDPITVCRPTTYGGYPAERTIYKSKSVATLVYLAETDDWKHPLQSTLGAPSEVLSPGVMNGHVARNMRMCLKLIELAKPEVIISQPELPAHLMANQLLSFEIRGYGCFQSQVRLLLIHEDELVAMAGTRNCSQLADSEIWPVKEGASKRKKLLLGATEIAEIKDFECSGIDKSLWGGSLASAPIRSIDGKVPPDSRGNVCVVVAAEFDQHWGTQRHPDPNVDPRSHAARLRLQDRYNAEANDGPMYLDEFKTKLFPVFSSSIAVKVGDAQDQTAKISEPGFSPWKLPTIIFGLVGLIAIVIFFLHRGKRLTQPGHPRIASGYLRELQHELPVDREYEYLQSELNQTTFQSLP